jgi:hypothetical protein
VTAERSAAEAARQAAEALRLLNHRSLPAAGRVGITGPDDAYQIIGALSDVPPRLAQALNQVADWLESQQRASKLDGGAHGDDPQTAVTAATWDLDIAADSLTAARDALYAVHAALGRLRAKAPSNAVGAAAHALGDCGAVRPGPLQSVEPSPKR